MSNEFEYELDLLALGVGGIGAIIASAWTLLPSVVYLGPRSGMLTQNKLWLELAGVGLLLVVGLIRVWRTSDGSWRQSDTSVFTQGGVTLLIGVVLLTQVVAPVAADITGGSTNTAEDTPTPAVEGSNLKVVHLDITGMSCPGCSNSISAYLSDQPGVKAVDITFEKKGGTVVYDPQQISAEEIATGKVFEGYYNATVTSVDDYEGNS